MRCVGCYQLLSLRREEEENGGWWVSARKRLTLLTSTLTRESTTPLFLSQPQPTYHTVVIIMSRQGKQADLRRRMAEARQKLLSTSSQPQTQQLDGAGDGGDDMAADSGLKRPAVPSGGGGILKKPKYAPVASTMAATDVVDGGKPEEVANKPNALGSLMGGYSSSDEDEGAQTNDKLAADTTVETASKPSASEKIIASKKPKSARFNLQVVEERIISDDVGGNELQKGPFEGSDKSTHEGGNGNTSKEDISDEVWDEFNALLDDDDGGAGANKDDIESANLKQLQAMSKAGNIGEEDVVAMTDATEPKKKKKKRKKDSTTQHNMYDNEAIANVEQASYEARLARLMLLKSKRNKNKATTGRDNGDPLVEACGDFYDPSLAFQVGGDEQDDENDAELKDVRSTQVTTESNATGESAVSLAKILRARRDEARQISSRGNDADDTTKSGEDEEDAPDGCWF